MKLWTRSIRPPDPSEITPNANPPASVPPSTVGPDQLVSPGNPDGVTVSGETGSWQPPTILPSAWSGWPSDWWTSWSSSSAALLADTAWMCIDYNSSILSTMPPYLVDAAPSLQADWLRNPDPDLYNSWEDMARALFWDYQAVGESFLLATARYATGWPARFHVVPPWMVTVELRDGLREYRIGELPVSGGPAGDLLHIRYRAGVDQARGEGPLEAGRARAVAAGMLVQYVTKLTAGGGIPAGVLRHPQELDPAQSAQLKADWVTARLSGIGEPAVLSGGITWEATQVNPRDMALLELANTTDSRIAYLLKVPGPLVGLPGGGDSLTYNTTLQIREQHWQAGLKPMAQTIMSAMSEWALPRGTRVEVNRDAYVQPEPLQRAQTAQILNAIRDEQGVPVMSVEQIQQAERLSNSTPEDLSSGVLK